MAVRAIEFQQFGYLVRRIRAMASGGRPAASWDHTGLFKSLSDDDIVGVADYLSRINPAQDPEP